MSRKIYVVGSCFNGYANWMNGTIVNKIENCDLVLFGGGEDVDPSIYNEPKGRHTYSNLNRDKEEVIIFNRAKELKKKCIGICRGAQFLCIMSKGRLVQHQDNPYHIHNIKTSTGLNIPITSSHHQAQNPYNLKEDKYEILAWTNGISKFHLDGENSEMYKKDEKEVEICYYKDTESLAIQGHPEWMWESKDNCKETFNYLHNLVDSFVDGK